MIDIKTTITLLIGILLAVSVSVVSQLSAKNRHLKSELENQTVLTEQYRQRAELWRSALDEHNARIKADAEKITAFEEKVKDLDAYIETLEDRNSVCLSAADIGRLRQLWGAEPVRP